MVLDGADSCFFFPHPFVTGSIFREVLLKLGTMALPIFKSANLSMVIVAEI